MTLFLYLLVPSISGSRRRVWFLHYLNLIYFNIKGTARKKIKQNFCCLKQCLVNCNIDGLIETSYQDKLINYATYTKMKDLRGSVLQIEGILKRVSEADDEKCWKFLSLMANVTGFNLRTLLKPGKLIQIYLNS